MLNQGTHADQPIRRIIFLHILSTVDGVKKDYKFPPESWGDKKERRILSKYPDLSPNGIKHFTVFKVPHSSDLVQMVSSQKYVDYLNELSSLVTPLSLKIYINANFLPGLDNCSEVNANQSVKSPQNVQAKNLVKFLNSEGMLANLFSERSQNSLQISLLGENSATTSEQEGLPYQYDTYTTLDNSFAARLSVALAKKKIFAAVAGRKQKNSQDSFNKDSSGKVQYYFSLEQQIQVNPYDNVLKAQKKMILNAVYSAVSRTPISDKLEGLKRLIIAVLKSDTTNNLVSLIRQALDERPKEGYQVNTQRNWLTSGQTRLNQELRRCLANIQLPPQQQSNSSRSCWLFSRDLRVELYDLPSWVQDDDEL